MVPFKAFSEKNGSPMYKFFKPLKSFKPSGPGNRNKGKGNGAGLARESQSHCFADGFLIIHAHFFVTDTHT